MQHQPRNEYLRTQIMTASPEMLTLMLWDGAIRFSEQAKLAIQNKEIENSYNLLLRAQKIVLELHGTLKHDLNPSVSQKIAALYMFIYRKLVDTNLHKDVAALDDALKIMRMQRETWQMLINKLTEERVQQAAPTANENAEAIGAAAEISPEAIAQAAKPNPVRRMGYPNLANKPLRTSIPAISLQG